MAFKEKDKLKALAVVNIFETGKALGDYAAIAVLDDGAGISYGVNQFTHRSGALTAVIERYFELGGVVGKRVINLRSGLLKKRTSVAVKALAGDEEFKKALMASAVTSEMQEAQIEIAFERYLKPALDVCEAKGFVLPLSLAVVYDSITHGSWEKISEKVRHGDGATRESDEKAWVTEYVRERDKWLARVPRLKKTRYRTQFFLKRIATGRWDLELPLNVNGVILTEAALCGEPIQPKLQFEQSDAALGVTGKETNVLVTEPSTTPAETLPETLPETSPETDRPQARTVPAEPPTSGSGSEDCLDKTEEMVNAAGAKYDQAERIVNTVITRKDAVKSLWTTVVGTILQTVWSIAAFFSDTPRAVWLVVAVIAGALTLVYLYRQMVVKRVRESSQEDKNEN